MIFYVLKTVWSLYMVLKWNKSWILNFRKWYTLQFCNIQKLFLTHCMLSKIWLISHSRFRTIFCSVQNFVNSYVVLPQSEMEPCAFFILMITGVNTNCSVFFASYIESVHNYGNAQSRGSHERTRFFVSFPNLWIMQQLLHIYSQNINHL